MDFTEYIIETKLPHWDYIVDIQTVDSYDFMLYLYDNIDVANN